MRKIGTYKENGKSYTVEVCSEDAANIKYNWLTVRFERIDESGSIETKVFTYDKGSKRLYNYRHRWSHGGFKVLPKKPAPKKIEDFFSHHYKEQ